jgi:hypothetical protein
MPFYCLLWEGAMKKNRFSCGFERFVSLLMLSSLTLSLFVGMAEPVSAAGTRNISTTSVDGATNPLSGGITTGEIFLIEKAPPTPTLVSPSGAITDTHPPYVWNASDRATSYTLAVYSVGSASYVIQKSVASSYCTAGVCTYHPATTLTAGDYRFKVLATNYVGSSPYSAWMTFGIPPAAPVLISPSGTISDTHPPYSWHASTGATSYRLAVWSVGYTSYVIIKEVYPASCTAGVCTYHPAFVLFAGAYRFKVLARIQAGSSPYSAWRNYTVAVPPAAPSPISPSGTTSDPHPPYIWTSSSSATAYTLAVYSNGSASYVFVRNVASSYCLGGVCTYHPSTNLGAGSYRFKVLAKNVAGSSPYSAWMNFTFSP